MRAQIRPNRLEVSDRFPMLGFTIRTDESPARAEVTVAADPSLFSAENKEKRTPANFYSSRVAGPLSVPRGEAVYLLPPEVLARFVGQPRLYAALAVAPERNGAPQVAVLPTAGSPYVSLGGLTGRSFRRVRLLPSRQDRMRGYGGNGNGALEWAGDAASPGVQRAGNGAGAAPAAPPSGGAPAGPGGAAPAPYDDGFGPLPPPSPAAGGTPSAPPPATPIAAARALDSAGVVVGSDRVPVSAPSVARLDSTQSILVEAALTALSGPLAPAVVALRAAARAADVSIGVGPAVGAGLGAGVGLGTGLVFGPDGGIGVYGAAEFQVGFLASVSATAQVTVVRGGIESFNGWGLAASVSGGEGIVGGASALFDLSGNFQGVSFQLGVGAGLTPVDFYVAVQRQVAGQLALAQAARARSVALSSDIPLDPGNGGMSIGPGALEIGDIIVSTTAAAISGAIRFASGSDVSHAMLYVGQGQQVIDATGDGVRLRPLVDALADATVAVAFRYPGLSDAQRQTIADKAAEYIGRAYDYWGIVKQAQFQVHRAVCDLLPGSAAEACRNFYGKVDIGRGSSTEFFCSELVVAAYQAADVPVTTTPPEWSSPDDLAQLGLRRGVLAYVGHLKAPPVEQRRSIWDALGLAAQARALAAESFSINWDDVHPVNQPTGVTCWAASAAMVVGWRDLQSVTPEYVAQLAGRSTVSGLDPDDRRRFAEEIGLVYEEPKSYSIDAFRALLETRGPLWVSVQLPGSGHAVVVTGMYSDGAPDGSDTFVRITDPWDRDPGTPGAPGSYLNTHDRGSRYILGWADFTREYEDRASTSAAGTVNAQILHAGGTGGRVPNRQTTPPGYAMSLSRSLARRHPGRARGLSDAPVTPEAALERARSFSPEVADVVSRLLDRGARPDDVMAFMDRLSAAVVCPPASPALAPAAKPSPPAPAPAAVAQGRASVRALEAEHRPARFPVVRTASETEKLLALAAITALSPATSGMILGLRAVANRHNVSIGVGPSASVGFLIGGGVGAGVIFAPGDQVGFYGQFDIRGGLIDSASLELQCTIVRGGIESFSGISWALAVEVDLAVSVSAQALFDASLGFQGVTFGLGVGLGVEPIQVFLSLQGSYAQAAAARGLAAAGPVPRRPPAQTRWARPLNQATGAPTPPPFPGAVIERVDGSNGNVRWQLEQLRGLKLPPGVAAGSTASSLAPSVRLSDWPYLQGGDGSTSLPLTVDWEYGSGGVGNVRIAAGEPHLASGVSLDVTARILDAPGAPAGAAAAPPVAALRVSIEYRFAAPDGTTPRAFTELTLYGDGQLDRHSRWQGALAA